MGVCGSLLPCTEQTKQRRSHESDGGGEAGWVSFLLTACWSVAPLPVWSVEPEGPTTRCCTVYTNNNGHKLCLNNKNCKFIAALTLLATFY